MPQIIMVSGANRLDGAIKGRVLSFLEKLTEDDTAPGLHIEPIQNVRDPRVRTGRVNQNFRAVLFKLEGGDETTYLFAGAWPHDDAIAKARQITLRQNPANGIPEIYLTPTLPPQQPPQQSASVDAHGAPAAQEPEPVLAAHALDDLVELGIDQAVAIKALEAVGDDSLLAVAMEAVPWQGEALVELGAGKSITEVQEALALDQDATEPQNDQELIEALKRPAAGMQFAFIEDNAELAAVIEDGDLAAWRIFLHPEQRQYATHNYNGPYRLSGGAGTGKTVVLIHRARHLARQNPNARILLTTFTTTLAEALRRDFTLLDPQIPIADRFGQTGVYIAGIDAVAKRLTRSATKDVREDAIAAVIGPRSGGINPRTNEMQFWSEVIAASGTELDATIANPTFMSAEYTTVVLAQQLTTQEQYLRARRRGRGVALDRAKRLKVWKLVESYRHTAAMDDTVDWAELSAIAAAATSETRPPFDHVLVDEGQDLTASHWRLIRALASPGTNDLFIAEDSQQRIYGQPIVLAHLGINIVGRSRRLTLNYRTTAENLAYALQILAGVGFEDAEGEEVSNAGARSARKGPEPEAIACKSLTDELNQADRRIRAWLDAGRERESIGVLVRDQQQMSRVVTGLNERGLDARQVDHNKTAGGGQVQVMTMHRAKGMEFECVLIFGAGRGDVPAEYLARDLDPRDAEDFLQRERSLLYVSATRARDELVVLWAGEPSTMLPSVD